MILEHFLEAAYILLAPGKTSLTTAIYWLSFWG